MWIGFFRRICATLHWQDGNMLEAYGCISVLYTFRCHESLVRRAEKQIIDERTLVSNLPAVIDHETNIWKISNTALLKALIRLAVDVALLHKAFEVTLASLFEPSFSEFRFMNGKGVKIQCHLMLHGIAANISEQKDLSCPKHGCETERQSCRCLCE